ncbi:MAG: transposase, partial [Blastococcus sp.]
GAAAPGGSGASRSTARPSAAPGRADCKLHLAVDGRGPPMAIRFTAGQAGDNPQLLPLLDEVAVAHPGRGGRGATRTG